LGTSKWTYQKTMRKESRKNVWQVAEHRGRIAYFKYPQNEFRRFRLMIANEYVSIFLAAWLGFPVAVLTPATVQGPRGNRVTGYISKQVSAREVITWKTLSAQSKLDPLACVNRIRQLLQAVVFDVWILNKDRTDVNLILHRDDPRGNYDWYLIDFGSALLGSPHNSPFARVKKMAHPQLKKRLRMPSGLPVQLLQHRQCLWEMIDKIERMPTKAIDKAIRNIPRGLIRAKEKRTLKRLLVYRKRRIRAIMTDVLRQLDRTGHALI